MPQIFRILGYGGNGILFALSIVGMFSVKEPWVGVFLGALSGLNLYLIRKIDLYSREEAWLETKLRKRELRRRIEALDAEDAMRAAAAPKQIEASAVRDDQPPGG